jgi:hypothetical protein
MVSKTTDFQTLQISINRARRLNPRLDTQFLLYCVDLTRKKNVERIDGGLEQISHKLRQAAKYQEECKSRIRAFWGNLAKEEDLSSLPEIVVSIERNEKFAESIYKQVQYKIHLE